MEGVAAVTDSRLAVATRLWRIGGRLRVSVVAKANFSLPVHGALSLAAKTPVVLADRFQGHALERASQMPPYLGRADVLVHGRAAAAQVRLGFGRGGHTAIDKRVDGTRDPELSSLGPVAAHWPLRAAKIAPDLLARVRGGDAITELPDELDWSFFQAAPADQQVPYLHGDEWLVLEGVHATIPRLHVQLAGACAEIRKVDRGTAAVHGRACRLAADMLVVDVAGLRASMIWRGRLSLATVDELESFWLAALLHLPGAPGDWSAIVEPAKEQAGTRAIDRDALPIGSSLPWERPGERAQSVGSPSPPSQSAPLSGATRGADPRPARPSMPWERPGEATSPAAPPPSPTSQAGATRGVDAGALEARMPWERPGEAAADKSTAPAAAPRSQPAPWERPGEGQAARVAPPEQEPSVAREASPGTVTVSADMLRRAMAAMPSFAKEAPRGLRPKQDAGAALPFKRKENEDLEPVEIDEPPPVDWIARPEAAEPEPGTKELSRDLLHRVAAPFGLAKARAESDEPQRAKPDLIGAPWAQQKDAEYQAVPGQAEPGTKAIERAAVLALLGRHKPRDKQLQQAVEGALIPARRGKAVPVVNATALEVRTMPWQIDPPNSSLTVIAKTTCSMEDDGKLTLIKSEAPTGPALEDVAADRLAIGACALSRYESDFVPHKPKADVTIVGHAYPASGRATLSEVRAAMGHPDNRFDRQITVCGDRSWRPGTEIERVRPAAFERMPLRLDHAYGGPGHPGNPVGRGYAVEVTGDPVLLPNLLAADGKGDGVVQPACTAPIPVAWRMAALDRALFGERWLKERWPYYPDGFDFATLQTAPREQQLGYLRGDEPFRLEGMRPGGATLSGTLPGIEVRLFAQRTREAGGDFVELSCHLDTVHFDLDEMRVQLVWRAVTTCLDEHASDISSIFVFTRSAAEVALGKEPASMWDAQRQHQALLVELEMIEDSPEGQPAAANDGGSPLGGRGERSGPRRLDAELVMLAAAGLLDDGGGIASPEPPEPLEDAGRRRAEKALGSGASLAGIDLSGAELSGLDFMNRAMPGANLKDANLSACRFDGADLSGAQLSGANGDRAVFDSAKLVRADLQGASLDQARFASADLSGANFARAEGTETLFLGASGEDPSFESARLPKACFDDARLCGADFSAAVLDDASFARAQLVDVSLLEARIDGGKLRMAVLDGARADGALLREADLVEVSAKSSVWEGADLSGSSFEAARLEDAAFASANCERTRFARAVLREARFVGARLVEASFHRADLMQASLERADLTGADLSESNLYAVETHAAQLRGAALDGAIIANSALEAR